MLSEDFSLRADLLRIAHEVQPVPRPAFAISPRLQQAVHHALLRLRRTIRDKRGDLHLRGWQASEIKGHTPQPCVRIGFCVGFDTRRLQLREDEDIHIVQRPGLVTHRRWRGIPHRLVGPVLAALLHINPRLLFHHRHSLARIMGTGGHPLLQDCDLALRQLRLRRHLQIGCPIAHGLDDATLLHGPRHQRRTTFTTRLPARARIQHQPALDLARVRMALVAARFQHWKHLRFKERHILRDRTCHQGDGAGERY